MIHLPPVRAGRDPPTTIGHRSAILKGASDIPTSVAHASAPSDRELGLRLSPASAGPQLAATGPTRNRLVYRGDWARRGLPPRIKALEPPIGAGSSPANAANPPFTCLVGHLGLDFDQAPGEGVGVPLTKEAEATGVPDPGRF